MTAAGRGAVAVRIRHPVAARKKSEALRDGTRWTERGLAASNILGQNRKPISREKKERARPILAIPLLDLLRGCATIPP